MEPKQIKNRALYAVQQTIRLVATICYLEYHSLRSSANPIRELFDIAAMLLRSLFYFLKGGHKSAQKSTPRELTPEQKEAKELRALLDEALQISDREKALSIYNKLVELQPAWYLGKRAEFYARNGEYELAVADYDECILQNPNMLSHRAHFFGTHGNLERAVQDYQTLIDLRSAQLETKMEGSQEYLQARSDLARPYWLRAYIYKLNDKFDSALNDYRLAASISPEFIRNYADYSQERGFLDSYLEALNGLVKLHPDAYLTRRARFYMSQGDLHKAKLDYDEAVRVYRRFGVKHLSYSPLAWALKERAELHLQIGDVNAAARDRKRSEKIACLQYTFFGFGEWPADDYTRAV